MGISVEKTIPYFHEQAGVVERSNRTIQSIMRCILFGSELPKGFWGMAVASAGYLHNKTINVNTGNKTPQELFMGTKPQVDDLRVFGSWAFVHIPAERRKKLDHRAVKARFVGYLAGSKGWKFWDPATNNFLESAHARWLTESASATATQGESRSEPVPDPPSDISRLLNLTECEEDLFLEALAVTYDLADSNVTGRIREQDRLVEGI